MWPEPQKSRFRVAVICSIVAWKVETIIRLLRCCLARKAINLDRMRRSCQQLQRLGQAGPAAQLWIFRYKMTWCTK